MVVAFVRKLLWCEAVLQLYDAQSAFLLGSWTASVLLLALWLFERMWRVSRLDTFKKMAALPSTCSQQKTTHALVTATLAISGPAIHSNPQAPSTLMLPCISTV